MSGLLGLSGSLPLSLSLCCFSLFSRAITPLFPAIVHHTVFFLPFFQVSKCSWRIYLCLTRFQSAQFISSGTILLLSLFIWILVSSRSVPYSAPLVHSFPPPQISLLWCCFFKSLHQIPIVLYLSLSPIFPPSFMSLLPLCFFFLCIPVWSRGFTLLTSPCLCKRASPSSPALSPAPSTLLFLLLLPYFLFFFSCLYLFIGLSKDFLLDRDVPASPAFTWGRWGLKTAVAGQCC